MQDEMLNAISVINMVVIIYYSQIMYNNVAHPEKTTTSTGFQMVICHSILFINLFYVGIYQLSKLFRS